MAAIQYNDANFRMLFPAFTSTATYPEALLQLYWNCATDYINACQQWWGVNGANQLTLALNQMTAHITYVMGLAAAGQSTGITVSAGIDKINTAIMPPPVKNMWQYWLATSPYGQQLLALLEAKAVGGYFTTAAYPFRLR